MLELGRFEEALAAFSKYERERERKTERQTREKQKRENKDELCETTDRNEEEYIDTTRLICFN